MALAPLSARLYLARNLRRILPVLGIQALVTCLLVSADEPTAFLDPAAGHLVRELLRSHLGRAALVVVTHDRAMLAGATRVLTLTDGALADA